jgi:hypothetical protein
MIRCDSNCPKPVTLGQISAPFVRLSGFTPGRKPMDCGHRAPPAAPLEIFISLKGDCLRGLRRPLAGGQAPGVFVPILLRFGRVRGILSRAAWMGSSFGDARIRDASTHAFTQRRRVLCINLSNNQRARPAGCGDRAGVGVSRKRIEAAFRHVICTDSDREGAAHCVRLLSK